MPMMYVETELSIYLESILICAGSYDIMEAIMTFTNARKQQIYIKSLKDEYCRLECEGCLSNNKGGNWIAALQQVDIC